MLEASLNSFFNLSHHASIRVKQRGIKLDALLTVLKHGDREGRAGRHRLEISLSKKECAELLRIGVPLATTDSARTIRALVAGASVITVYRA